MAARLEGIPRSLALPAALHGRSSWPNAWGAPELQWIKSLEGVEYLELEQDGGLTMGMTTANMQLNQDVGRETDARSASPLRTSLPYFCISFARALVMIQGPDPRLGRLASS
eukprot:1679757-Pyramimonas_sp.AAC.1